MTYRSTVKKIACSTSALVTILAAMQTLPAAASEAGLPTGGRVVAGSATIGSPSDASQTITQSSKRAIINWNSFDVAKGNSLIFVQPDASSTMLNRVTGDTTSTIAGQIQANGSIFLINPNGIQITKDGAVHAGRGFVASTLDIANDDFMSGNGSFTGTGGLVSHQGTITTGSGGFVGLLGGAIESSGYITAPAGKVVIGAATRTTLDLNGGGFLQVTLPATATISGDGSMAAASVADARNAVRDMVYLPDNIDARTVSGSDGHIILGGIINVDNPSGHAGSILALGNHVIANGTLSARATGASGNGGFIETSGKTVDFTGVSVNTSAVSGATGTWLIDPTDITIDAVQAATIENNLIHNNVELETVAAGADAGNININSAIRWSANTLTLNAHNDININAVLTASGTAGLALNHGNTMGNAAATPAAGSAINLAAGAGRVDFTGNGNSLSINGNGYTIITALGAAGSVTATDLQGISGDLTGNYALGANIDASATSGWNAGAGFAPIGNNVIAFTGAFNGLGHVITGLTIDRPNQNYTGLFGVAGAGSTISNIGMSGGDITGAEVVGGLVGLNANGTVSQSYATGTVKGDDAVGGLIGSNSGMVSQSHATGAVQGNDNVGGLVGQNDGTVSQSYATGVVHGLEIVGGLAGSSYGGIIDRSYATGAVTGEFYVGGLAGFQFGGTADRSYATGAVTGDQFVGGLVGFQFVGAANRSYATGAVTGDQFVGGLIGQNNGAMVSQSYATGAVIGADLVGGLIGESLRGTISNNYWDSFSTGQALGIGIDGGDNIITNIAAVTSDPTQSAAANYAYKASAYGNFTVSDWIFIEGQTRPFGAWEAPTLVGGVATITNSHQLQLIKQNLGANYLLGSDIDLSGTGRIVAGTPGSYSGMWSSAGFSPIGTFGTEFTGALNGLGNEITNLTINRPGQDYVGLFGLTGTGSSISNIGLSGSNITGNNYVGGLVGGNHGGTVSQSYATGAVQGNHDVGGLIGSNQSTVSQSYATVAVRGNSGVGGLIGNHSADGGLIGNSESIVRQSYATGRVSGNNEVGGLIGSNASTVSQSYATGAVKADDTVGGLIGGNHGGTVSQSYATGAVQGGRFYGGLIGFSFAGTFSNNYWDSYSTGQASAIFGSDPVAVAVTSDPAKSGAANYAYKASAWRYFATGDVSDIDTVGGQNKTWRIYEGNTAPLLKAFLTAATVNTNTDGRTFVYDGLVKTSAAGYSLSPNANPSDVLGELQFGTNAGTYIIGLDGLYSGQQGLDLVLGTGGSATIDKRALTVTAEAASRIYGDANPALTYIASGLVNGDSLSGGLATTAGLTSDVGTYAITQGSLAASPNYTLTYTGANLSVTARPLSVTADEVSRIYGDANPALTYIASGLVNGDSLSGGLATTAGITSNVGTYAITQGSLAASSNYALTYTGANLSVTARPLSVTADEVSRIYGDTNPALTYIASGLVNGDSLSGGLATTAGITSNVGTYAITQGTLANSNYAINYTGANLTVTALPQLNLTKIARLKLSSTGGSADGNMSSPQFSSMNGKSSSGLDLNPVALSVAVGGENDSQTTNSSPQTSDEIENESDDAESCADGAGNGSGSCSMAS